MTIIPAYGRDYKSAKAVRADWAAGKDFKICDMFDPDDGRYINNADAERTGGRIMIRFDKLRKITEVKS